MTVTFGWRFLQVLLYMLLVVAVVGFLWLDRTRLHWYAADWEETAALEFRVQQLEQRANRVQLSDNSSAEAARSQEGASLTKVESQIERLSLLTVASFLTQLVERGAITSGTAANTGEGCQQWVLEGGDFKSLCEVGGLPTP